jgi:thiosulfate/3-mercaptopyruvate sulfurtransferase
MTRADVLITAPELREALARSTPPVLIDVRWALGDPNGRADYEAGHIPTAVFGDLETELAAPPTRSGGRHPLPAIDDLQRTARVWGITRRRPVVLYDNTGGRAAARGWWLLRWAGVPDVRLLDGGLGAWIGAGYPTTAGAEVNEPGDIDLIADQLTTLAADEAANAPVLLDARAGERFRGEVEPVDSKAGHIPGARNARTDDNLTDEGTFRADAELAAHYGALGATASSGKGAQIAVYCGSGVTAAHDIAALAIIGVNAGLYPGSWSAWSADPGRPIAVGERAVS